MILHHYYILLTSRDGLTFSIWLSDLLPASQLPAIVLPTSVLQMVQTEIRSALWPYCQEHRILWTGA